MLSRAFVVEVIAQLADASDLGPIAAASTGIAKAILFLFLFL